MAEPITIVVIAIGTIWASCKACGWLGKLFVRDRGKNREGHYCPQCHVTTDYKTK